MATEHTVAVIIPTRNRAEYLECAVRSVLAQTHDELEVVIIDGGSTDATPDIAEQLQEETTAKELLYIRNDKPRGLPAARNQGAARTESDYIAFLDDDDMWHPEKIEQQLAAFKDAPDQVGVVHTGFRSEHPDGTHIHTKRPTHEGDIYEELLARNVIGPPSTVMVRRNAYDRIGGFDEDLRQQEDWDFYLRLAQEYEFAYVSAPLVTRLVHDDTMSRDVATQNRYRKQILEQHETELVEQGLKSTAWAAHHREAGIMSCRNGKITIGRREFRRSLGFEFNFQTAVLYCSTLFGEFGFAFLVKLKRQLMTTLNKIRTNRGPISKEESDISDGTTVWFRDL